MLVNHSGDTLSDQAGDVNALEQQLLDLGPLPRRGEASWTSQQWDRYARIVAALAERLVAATPDDHPPTRVA
jgi:hypothetical protein